MKQAVRSLAFLCLVALMVACRGSSAPKGQPLMPPDVPVKGEIQVWGWNIAAASLEKLLPSFHDRQPDVRVNVVMSGMNMQSRLLLSLSAGVGAPDISQLQIAEAPFYAQTRRMTDLSAVAKKYEDRFPPSFWQNCVFEGKVYAIPWDMGPCAVFYKRHLFERYGIDPQSIETWADYTAAGRQVLERSGGKTKMLFLPTGNLETIVEILLQQTGGQLFDAQGRVAVNSPQVRKAVEVLREMLHAGIGANEILWSHAFYASLKSDAVASYPLAAWFGGTIKDHAPDTAGDWGVFRLPAIEPGGLRTSNYGGSVLVIPEQSPNKEAAWVFIEYALCTREGQLEQFRNFDLFPALLTTHSDPFFDEPLPFFGGQQVRKLFREDIERIPPLNRPKDWNEALRYLRQTLSDWVSAGAADSDQLLRTLERRLSSRLGRAVAPVAGGE